MNLLRRTDVRWLVLLGVLLHLAAALFSAGYFALDEHFQILEFAALKLGTNQPADLSWEYDSRIRPALQPAMAYLTATSFQGLGIGSPFTVATALRLLTTLLSLLCMYLLYVAFRRELPTERLRIWLIYLSLCLWFLPYLHARFSAEILGGTFFWIGFALLYLSPDSSDADTRSQGRDLLVGLLLGLGFVLRFQLGIMIAGLFAWLLFCRRMPVPRLVTLVSGLALAIGLGTLIDRWFYGQWVFTPWAYLDVNLLQGRAAYFGTSPWWFYFERIGVRGIPPVSIVAFGAAFATWLFRPRHVVTWITLPFFLIHVLLGHKEMRFLFSLANIVPFMMVFAASLWLGNPRLASLKGRFASWGALLTGLFVVINTAACVVAAVKPAEPLVGLYEHIYDHYAPESTLLVYEKHNPYERAEAQPELYPDRGASRRQLHPGSGPIKLRADWYRDKSLPLVALDDVPSLAHLVDSSVRVVLYATPRHTLPDSLSHLKMVRVYRYLPDWILDLNVTNWVDRTNIWSVYECRPAASPP